MGFGSPSSGEREVQQISVTIAPLSSETTTVNEEDFVSVVSEIPNEEEKLPIVGVIDPSNVSTNEANLINGNTTDLHYNNSSQGTNNKELAAIDLGSKKAVSKIVIWWWNNTYIATNFKIQGNDSNSSNGWTDVASGLSATGVGEQQISVSGSYRYWRLFCVTGANSSWCVVSEMEAYNKPAGNKEWYNNAGGKVSTRVENGKIVLENNTEETITATINKYLD